MTRVSPPPHAARPWRQSCARDLAIVAEFPPDFSFRQKLSRSAAGALGCIPEAITVPAGDFSVDMIDRANAPTTQRTRKPQPLTHDATVCPNQRHDHSATGDQLQIERARIQPHHTQPRKAKLEKNRAHRPNKHMPAHQFAHVERDHAVVFDGAFAFRFRDKRGRSATARLRQLFATTPLARLIGWLVCLWSPHFISRQLG